MDVVHVLDWYWTTGPSFDGIAKKNTKSERFDERVYYQHSIRYQKHDLELLLLL